MIKAEETPHSDILLIGSGIMSATLGALLKRAFPEKRIRLLEAAEGFSPESSDAWHNAGTGHAGICELSYTPKLEADGSVNVNKAIEIFTQFEKSRQFWSSAVKEGLLQEPRRFLNPVPHVSFVWGAEQVKFLKARYQGLKQHHFFSDMEYTEDPAQILEWAPLLMRGRSEEEPVAATRMKSGTDVNFGEIARQLVHWLGQQAGCETLTQHRVIRLRRQGGTWAAIVRDENHHSEKTYHADFVFIGAGGGSLPLLQSAHLPEAYGYGGFPVGGQWLVCEEPGIVAQHEAKVYGQALGAAPTMAVPHLDTRVIDGKKALLFGPYAAWTTKFLHETGHPTDLFRSLTLRNLLPMIQVGIKDFSLVRYLIGQGLQSFEDRMETLRGFYPEAKAEDWRLRDAGIRVQAITQTDGVTGIVHFGTEVLTSEDKSMAALLGASPGASVSVQVMLDLFEKCFGSPAQSDALATMIPSLRQDLREDSNSAFYLEQKSQSDRWLEL